MQTLSSYYNGLSYQSDMVSQEDGGELTCGCWYIRKLQSRRSDWCSFYIRRQVIKVMESECVHAQASRPDAIWQVSPPLFG